MSQNSEEGPFPSSIATCSLRLCSVSVVVSRIFVNSKTTTLEVEASIYNVLPANNSRMDVPTDLLNVSGTPEKVLQTE
jgi:hypothetical protein